MGHRWRLLAAAVVGGGLAIGQASPANAVHLFPLTPTFDPIGHDCAKALTPTVAERASTVTVAGFSFSDSRSRSSTTTITAGQSVTWTWTFDHCHSVTFPDGRGTQGADGFMPAGQTQLVRIAGAGNDSFTLAFTEPGTYAYSCVHHASVGMTGTVVVTAAAAAPAPSSDSPPSSSGTPPGNASASTQPAPTLPATGSLPSTAPAGALLVAAFVMRVLSRRPLARN